MIVRPYTDRWPRRPYGNVGARPDARTQFPLSYLSRSETNTRTPPIQLPHTAPTARAATVWSSAAPVVSPACEDPLRGSASAVPDLTLTPRGPRGRGRERLRQMVVQAGRGGKPPGHLPIPRFPEVSPRTPLPSAPPAHPVGPLRGQKRCGTGRQAAGV